MLRNFILVGLGGAIGSMLRYLVTVLLPRASTASFPLATLTVNFIGCFVIGALAGFTLRVPWMTHYGWALLATGVCGGFTTFSAFGLDGIKLIESGATGTMLAYTMISVCGGILLCFGGYFLTK